ncbi:hypothetical protein MNB_SUP05-SYMBIONT-4-750 [hydrothermal vent metagenome]|uniref:DUF8196 domain-containing protein n=1 Tax=hydrothermal vent metagenome TaxID=652676 RepID=A0A1W1E0Y9_9ZZZZ
MTDQELKDLVASLAIQSAKTDKQLAETDKVIANLAIQSAKTTKELAETGEYIKKMSIELSGMGKTSGEITQEFFFSSLDKTKQLSGVKFDSIGSNIRIRKAGKEHEMDIFLENGNAVGIVEVKTKVRKSDIAQLQTIVQNFHQFHPTFKSMKIIPALAGKVFPDLLQKQALKQGITVITQCGDHIEQQAP